MYEMRNTRGKFRNRVYTEPRSQFMSLDSSRNGQYDGLDARTPGQRNSLNIFHQQLNGILLSDKNKNSRLLHQKKKEAKLANLNMQHSMELSEIKSGLDSLKYKVSAYKKHGEISDAITLLMAKRANERSVQLPSIHQPSIQIPIVPPIPIPPMIPYPYYHPEPRRQPDSESESEEERRPKKMSQKELKNKKKMKKLDREKNRARLNKILKKVFRAVTYIMHLKWLVKRIMAKRRTIFDKYWPEMFQKSTNGMRKWFSMSCKQFFAQMAQKSQVELPIEGDESQGIITQKKKTIKALISILIHCLQTLTQNQVFEQVSQIVHIFCKHGALIDNGVLTPEQLQTVCISDIHGYLRLDSQLQKSQIINFVFLKLIIYNMLLQPWKYNEELFNINENKQAYENFYYLASVFYQIVQQVQDRFIEGGHGDCVEVGNWRKLRAKFKIKCSPSLCHLESNHQKGEMISGLVSDRIIEQAFPSSFWTEQYSIIEAIVERMHTKLRKVHAKFINETYDYKDMGRFAD